MTGLWLWPLLLFAAGAGALGGLAYFAWRRSRGRRGGIMGAVAVCIAVPAGLLGALVLYIAIASALEPTDRDLFEELYGRPAFLREEETIFDAFGKGPTREIWMRAEIAPDQFHRLLAIPRLTRSERSASSFEELGDQYGFTWWLTVAKPYGEPCPNPALYNAQDSMGWRSIDVATCQPGRWSKGLVYVVAKGRSDRR